MSVEPERIHLLNRLPVRMDDGAAYVLYWMQQSQRAHDNPALDYAIQAANQRALPLLVVFGLTSDFPEANLRHYTFMLEGLRETAAALRHRGAGFIMDRGAPDEVALRYADRAALLVADVGYLRLQRQWRKHVAREAPCRVVAVEGDVLIPVETVSDHEEFAARTIRPKIHRLLPDYLGATRSPTLNTSFVSQNAPGLDDQNPDAILRTMKLDCSVPPSPLYHGGRKATLKQLTHFAEHLLPVYEQRHSDPSVDGGSHMSAALHFGQISPGEIARTVLAVSAGESSKEVYLEELIVRRELSMNYVFFNAKYDHYESLPTWAQATLDAHADDPRPVLYTPEQLEQAQTGDPFWNAAQNELRITGCMHNYLRMYWGKKIIEWSPTPEQAWQTALFLNNRYELDGRDPNGFTGVAWCFGKHDRPWTLRPVFGTIRYMNAAGLQRKFDMPRYLERIAALRPPDAMTR